MNLDGQLVSAEERAETMASYLERVQWKVRPTSLISNRTRLGPILDIDVADISIDDVVRALKKLKYGKSCGLDGLYPEFWKALLEDDAAIRLWFLFVNDVGERKLFRIRGIRQVLYPYLRKEIRLFAKTIDRSHL